MRTSVTRFLSSFRERARCLFVVRSSLHPSIVYRRPVCSGGQGSSPDPSMFSCQEHVLTSFGDLENCNARDYPRPPNLAQCVIPWDLRLSHATPLHHLLHGQNITCTNQTSVWGNSVPRCCNRDAILRHLLGRTYQNTECTFTRLASKTQHEELSKNMSHAHVSKQQTTGGSPSE